MLNPNHNLEFQAWNTIYKQVTRPGVGFRR